MKILMLGWELPPFNSGGLGEACQGLAKALTQKGVDITFVLPRSQKVSIDGVRVVFTDIDEEIMEIRNSYSASSEYSRLFNKDEVPPDFVNASLMFAKKIGKLATKFNSDIIHSHDWLTSPAGIVSKGVLGKPLVAHVHSTEFDRTGGNFPNQIIYEIEKQGLLMADRVLPVGGFMKKILIEKYGVSPDKIEVVYNGIDYHNEKIYPQALNAFKKMGYKIILFLGRITLQKGPEYFVRAAAKALNYYPKSIYVVTGSGDMKTQMIAEAARLNILDKFIFTGFLRGEDRDKIFQCADLFVMPSVSEPFGITALEAAANDTPVLVSKQSGVSEIFQHSLKTDFWDIDEMASKIVAVLKYEALSKDIRRESAKEIKGFSWGKAADKVIQVYKELI
jgi:glycogen synthase